MIESQNFFQNFITSGIKDNVSDNKVRKAIIINLFSLVGTLSLLFFTIKGLNEGKYLYSIILSFFLILIALNSIIFRLNKNEFLAGNFVVTLMFLMELILLTRIGESITGLFWFYLFPLLSFFMLGRKIGLIYTTLLPVVAIIVFKAKIESFTIYPEILHFRFLFTYIVTALLSFIFEAVRARTYKSFKIADKEKTEYLHQALESKEEILVQSKLLEEKNTELEKLSMVASKANSAVLIMDANGKFEWVNDGFHRLYGIGVKELLKQGNTIFEASNNADINNVLQTCRTNKEPCYYEYTTKGREGKTVWVQTNITPILNSKKEIEKFIAIDTDITQIKEAEFEILQKNEEISTQKDELEEKNKFIEIQNNEIKSSINAAKIIQDSILRFAEAIQKKYNFFVIFKPKDIVSGDFYWYQKYSENNKIYDFFAVVDCTGHGVPGAFMSMISSQILNKLVNELKINSPAQILEELDKNIRESLKQDKTDNKNGLDICLCRIEQTGDNSEITFSGAKRPLIFIDAQSNKTTVYKGERRSIGGIKSRKNVKFTNTKIKANKNDLIYLTSDGYIDQNNPERKRFGTNKLLEIIIKNIDKDLPNQKNILETALANHMKDSNQRDDITIMGLKL